MAFFKIDLSTQAGARRAATLGSWGCFAFAALTFFVGVVLGSLTGFETVQGVSFLIGAAIEVAVALIAGLRLRAGKGAFWGLVTAVILALELALKLSNLANIVGIVIDIAILIVILIGVRGAFALRKGGFADADGDGDAGGNGGAEGFE